jgi:hypothetical protein
MTGHVEENNENNSLNFVTIYIDAYFIKNAHSFLPKPHLMPLKSHSSLP